MKKIENRIVTVEILNDGKLGSKKNMCLPGTTVNLPTVTELDEHDIVEFGLRHRVDFIALSFARYKTDINRLRRMLVEKSPAHGSSIQIISKI